MRQTVKIPAATKHVRGASRTGIRVGVCRRVRDGCRVDASLLADEAVGDGRSDTARDQGGEVRVRVRREPALFVCDIASCTIPSVHLRQPALMRHAEQLTHDGNFRNLARVEQPKRIVGERLAVNGRKPPRPRVSSRRFKMGRQRGERQWAEQNGQKSHPSERFVLENCRAAKRSVSAGSLRMQAR